MATVNVGTALARSGKRVLLVDFDLEAPSLPSFNLPASSTCGRGIVEYISDYLKSDRAQDVREYVSAPQEFPSGGVLWIMPAGASSDDYHTRLADINWLDLYENRSGFLLIEDMKAQWNAALAPDYVLIDSRTGHSDVSGICTRQLPDAVCFMFALNRQTLDGLSKTVQQVRSTREGDNVHPIALFFVESNVPYYDDERRTLAKNRRIFTERLGIRRFDATLHQYPHLSLLDRSVFVDEFPDTNLAEEYRALTETLRRENFQDRGSVLPHLKQIAGALRTPWGVDIFDENRRIDEISALHGTDPEICFWLGRISGYLGEFDEAMIQLDRAIEGGYRHPECYIERASLKLKEQSEVRVKEAVDDFRAALMLLAQKPRYSDVLYATRTLLSITPDIREESAVSIAIDALPPEEQIRLTAEISTSYHGISLAYSVLHRLKESGTLEQKSLSHWRIASSLACIYLKRFREAIGVLSEVEQSPDDEQCRLFNRGVALWAEESLPPREEFDKLLTIDRALTKRNNDPNYLQCIAIASYVTGDREHAIAVLERARRLAEQSPRLHFSAWKYCKVPPAEFTADCIALRHQIDEGQTLSFPAIQQTDLGPQRTH